ncbi:MAG: GNAT family N-acetyltransferase [Pseudomonadota bacterium]
MTAPPVVVIRPVEARDYDAWRQLWTGYLTFYEASVSNRIYEITWQRLLSHDPQEFHGLLAVDESGRPVGLTHYLFHRHCWYEANVLYLQDLFVDPAVRGTGAGRALIEAVYRAADEAGAASVYWLTQEHNTTARQLYDRVATVTPFIKYAR